MPLARSGFAQRGRRTLRNSLLKPIEVTDPLAQSADLTAEKIDQLRQLFPEAITEDASGRKVDFDVLRDLLGDAISESEEKFGLNWHGKRAARRLALTPSTGTLRPSPEDSVDWDTTQNLMIEGDNLEVLKLLQKSYAGKVKMIYIDPPYNTGKDFVYKDDFKDSIGNYQRLTRQVDSEGAKTTTNSESSGRYHTDWLNMLYPRLLLARNLLRDDGVILISIDDHEVQNVRTLLNDSFGEVNFVASLVWEKGRKNDAKLVSVGHEYLLLFARSLSTLRENGTVWREDKPGARDIWDEYLRLRKKHGEDDKQIQTALEDWYSALPKTNPAKKWSRYRRIDKNDDGAIGIYLGQAEAVRDTTCCTQKQSNLARYQNADGYMQTSRKWSDRYESESSSSGTTIQNPHFVRHISNRSLMRC